MERSALIAIPLTLTCGLARRSLGEGGSPRNFLAITQEFTGKPLWRFTRQPYDPSSTDRVAFRPPISVRTQPGQTEFTANFGNAAASCDVTPFSAVLEMQ